MSAYPLDPELAAASSLMPRLDFADIHASRQMAAELAEAAPPADTTGLEILDRTIAVDGPDVTVALRIYRPLDAPRPMPAIYDLHPGGFCAGSLANVHHRDVELALELEATVVAIDYRLAPEHPYPTGLEDCYAGLRWIAANAAELAIDTSRIAIHGQSGGGGLAAAVALLARDRGGPSLCFQFLGVPEIDDRLDTPSMRRFVDTPFWNRPNAEWSWRHYLADAPPDQYAAPARAVDLRGLPPAYITAMQFDPLRDEGIAYAQKLLAADVPVELHVFPATFHASNAIAAAEVSQRELAEEIAVLRRALHG